jgi:phosphoglycerate dehydrogenase-like enzyme
MSFKLLIYAPDVEAKPNGLDHNVESWPEILRNEIPNIEVSLVSSQGEAIEVIQDCDAAFGNIDSEIFGYGKNLKWVACPQAGPPAGWYHGSLIDSQVVVTNTREIYNDHISTHIMAFLLSFARGLHKYAPHQYEADWHRPSYPIVHLPDSVVLIVGVGGIGAETARLCSEFGATVIGSDPRVEDKPVGVHELYHPDDILGHLARADFVISTVPETPYTQNYFNSDFFSTMKKGSFFINIGRGATLVLDDLDKSLRAGHLAGAALDVFQVEPLPNDHPLWSAPGVIITPHVAGEGPYLPERRTELFIENCKRFANGETLKNIVDKKNWF